MSRKIRYLIPLLIVFITGVAVVHRIGIINGGRRAEVLRLDSELLARFKTVGQLEEEGSLTIMTGREIMNHYRAQLPVNPHVFAQFINLQLEPRASYILTNNSEINRALLNTLDQARVYRDQFGNEYDGRRYPNAYVLEFSAPPSELEKKQLAYLEYPDREGDYFLKISDRVELENFFRIAPPERRVSLILDAGLELPPLSEETREKVVNIYVAEDNARRIERDDFIYPDRFLYTSEDIVDLYLAGIFNPLGRYFYRLGLLIVGLIICYLGLFHHEQPLRWLGWGGFLLLATFAFSTHVVALGVVLAGLFVYGWRRKYRRLIWYMLGGMIMFGFYFTPYLLRLYASGELFWGGVFAGGAIFLSPVRGWRRKFVTAGDLLELIALGAVVWLFFYLPPANYQYLFSDRAWLLIIAPLLARVGAPETGLDEFLFLTSLGGWLYILTGGAAYLNLIGFIFALVFRTLQKSYLNFEGTT